MKHRSASNVIKNLLLPLLLITSCQSSSGATAIYFYPQEIAYDGFFLAEQFMELTPYELRQSTYFGTGGAYEVEYQPSLGRGRCVDGDTTVFYYPQDVYDLIESSAKSTRYFNINAPEISGTPDKWGIMAKNYVCEQLVAAESVVLQSDPGDHFVDTYGRLLAWVWIKLPDQDEFQSLNYMVVRQGLASVAYLFGAGETPLTVDRDKTYTEWMWEAELHAQLDHFGMYSSLKDPYS